MNEDDIHLSFPGVKFRQLISGGFLWASQGRFGFGPGCNFLARNNPGEIK
jgi:hypothetical protein